MQTITKVYDKYENAQSAVRALEASGIPTANISVVANQENSHSLASVNDETEAVPGAGLGVAVGGTAGLLTGLGIMAIPGLGPVVAAGWLATTVLGLVAGGATGGIVGSLIGAGVSEEHAHVYSEAVKRGGTLVTVRTEERDLADAQRILGTYQPIDPAVQGAAYRRTGWSEFDSDESSEEDRTTEAQRKRV